MASASRVSAYFGGVEGRGESRELGWEGGWFFFLRCVQKLISAGSRADGRLIGRKQKRKREKNEGEEKREKKNLASPHFP